MPIILCFILNDKILLPHLFEFVCFTNPIFSIIGTKNKDTNKDTARLIITTAAKSCKFNLILSSRKKMMTNAPIVVSVAANTDIKAFRLRRWRIWSAITIVLSITRFNETVIPANE